jgi:subtilisin family serine protease
MRTIESWFHSSIRMMFSGFIVVLILFSSIAGVMPIFTVAEPSEINNELTDNTNELTLEVTDQNMDQGYQIIQFDGSIRESWKEQVTALGVELFGYLPDFAFLADINKVPKTTIINLQFITSVQPYLPEHKYSTYFFDQYSNSGPIEIIINLFHDIEPEQELDAKIEQVANKIVQLGGEITETSQNKFYAVIEPDQIPKLAELNEVLWIEPVLEFEYLNDVAAGIIDVQPVWENLTLNGTGQVVTVCDSGLDNGSYANLHEDFRGRLIHAYAIGRSGIWNDANIHDFKGDGVGGHGTHVAGSVLGAGNHSAGQYRGVAYNASLVFQATMTTNGALAIPNDMYNNLFFPPYNTYGSRIHTNSWGTAQNPGEYSTNSRSVDSFIWDYPNQVILFAAGNSQTQSNVFSPSTAKNCITVGASESFRPSLPGYSSECNNINQRAYFSCYGTADNRLKPDILAPGTGILSTRSSMIDDVTNHYWVAYDSFYAYAGGTSMATPVTAGVVTLIRQYYTDLEGIMPSAALVKATLMNGAIDMEDSGSITPPPIPTYQEGWGRINLENSIFPELPSNLLYIDNETGLTTDKNFAYTVEVLNDSIPLNITLVWSDYPATVF